MAAFRSGPRPLGKILIKGKSMTSEELRKARKKPDSTMKPERAESPDERGEERKSRKKFMDKRTGDKKDPNDVIIKKEKPEPKRVPGKQKEMIPLRPEGMTPMAKGGRAGFKSGSKGCKLAMKGKGRAYGKNS